MSPRPSLVGEVELMTADDFAAVMKVSRRTLYRKLSKGEVPKPVRIGKGTVRWRVRDVRSFLEKLSAK